MPLSDRRRIGGAFIADLTNKILALQFQNAHKNLSVHSKNTAAGYQIPAAVAAIEPLIKES
jgi:hypothetical protein